MRKYKTWEAIKMLEEKKAKEFKFKNVSIENVNEEILFVANGEYAPMCGLTIGIEWELVQQPVSFIEAITGDGNIRVEHQLIEDSKNKTCANEVFRHYWRKFVSGEYMLPTQLLCIIGWMFKLEEAQDIIKNGKWYIEGE